MSRRILSSAHISVLYGQSIMQFKNLCIGVTRCAIMANKFILYFVSGDDVSSVNPSSSLSDLRTKMTFRALALCRHFPIRVRR